MAKATDDLAQFVKKSTFITKRTAEHKSSLEGEFVYETARLRISGQVDLPTGRLDSLNQQLMVGETSIFKLTRSSNNRMTRAKYEFGNGTEGVRTLVVNYERIITGTLATGYADGKELVPYITKGHCSCSEDKERQKPLLAWTTDTSTQEVRLTLLGKLAKPQLEGLATVTTQVAQAIASSGDLGDWAGDIAWFICFLACIPRDILCILTQRYPIVCFVFNCVDYCNLVGGF